jgi:SAM-dependent methyltransferase
MSDTGEFGAEYAHEQLRRSRHPLRRAIKRFYLDNILADVRGRTIDFGCGAGQLLERLPPGSVGFEINRHLVERLRARGLDARPYDPDADRLAFDALPAGLYRTFVIAHVLEHFADAASVLRTLLGSCARLGVERVIVVVPGRKGYASDPTHKTFIDRRYLEANGLGACGEFALARSRYFPIDRESIGDHFVFHEFTFVYDRLGRR